MIALPSAEAEFVAVSSMVQEVICTRRILERIGFSQPEPSPVFKDNRICVAWSEGLVGGSDRAKHIDLRAHFVHVAVDKKFLKFVPIDSASNVADELTKPLLSTVLRPPLRKRLMGL